MGVGGDQLGVRGPGGGSTAKGIGTETVSGTTYLDPMQMPPEPELRDFLVHHLELIEPGLRPVQTKEYRLPNSVGAHGQVDILARDRHGMWVVIELKRSTTSSRQALHEVAKYTELLRREKQLAADRIRAIIVSTDWHELLVPVSNMARDWTHDLRGYHLQLNSQGTPACAERISLLQPSFEHRISPIHVIYTCSTEASRREAWQLISCHARTIGADDILAVEFARVKNFNSAAYHYGIYLAIGRVDRTVENYTLDDHYDGPEPFAAENPAEYDALCKICNYLSYHRTGFGELEGAAPGSLRTIADDPSWKLEKYHGTGAFNTLDAYEESDLFRLLTGDDRGQSQIQFSSTASPAIRSRWNGFKREVETSLSGNAAWHAIFTSWLSDAASHAGEGDVALHVYNPCDFLQSVITGWPNNLDKYLPMVQGVVQAETGYSNVIYGHLAWDGTSTDLRDAVKIVYGERLNWIAKRFGGVTWIDDELLLELVGLRYVATELVGVNPSGDLAAEKRIWLFDGKSAQVYSSLHQPQHFGRALNEISRNGRLFGAKDFLKLHHSSTEEIFLDYKG